MSLKIVLLTRSSRPSGALMAWRLLQAGMPPAAVIVEKRRNLIKKKGSPASLLFDLGFSFLWKRLLEALRILGHFYLRKLLKKKFKNPIYLSIEELALDYPIEIYEVENHNGSETASFLRRIKPDIGILTNTRRINQEILQIPTHGFLNLHLSALPQYAGLDSIFWALYHGEKEIGVTVHFAAPEIDRGDIVLQRKIAVSDFDDENSLYEKALWLGTHLMVQTLKQVEAGAVHVTAQDSTQASYFSWPTPQERADFYRRKKRKRFSIDHRFSQGTARVLHVITRMIRGGAQENTLATALGLLKKGYRVTLITGHAWGNEGEILSEALEGDLEVVMMRDLVRDIHPWKDWSCFLKLVALLCQKKYVIVHTHTSKAGLLGRAAARWCKVPVIIHEPHGHVFHSYFSTWKEKLFLALERKAAHGCDRLIALTEAEKREHLELGVGSPDQWVVIPSGVNEKLFQEVSKARKDELRSLLGIDSGRRVVGFVGRFVAIKGARYLLEAIPAICRAVPAVHFLFVGDGEEKPSYEKRVSELGLSDRVTFTGHQPRVAEFLSLIDVLVVPSLNEGMGRVIVEGGLLGKAVIGTQVGGIPDLLEDGKTGLLVPPRDPEAISHAAIRLLKDPPSARKLGEELCRKIYQGFTEEQMIQRIHTLYQELLHEKGRISSSDVPVDDPNLVNFSDCSL